ncbi:Methionine aminopeptidase 1D chloroplastic/mitochondrial [Zea mays]|uniref:Pectin acetylesterase n=1 Tax=Zea mays TaxID=4577 RepID=A0A1D6LVW0_MAIZE|nr:Methionine aminopeptidase 1D chloroplastic/mitochondrial [Zea mays]
MPSPTRASVASLPTAGAVLSCRAHRASRWPTHTRSTLHPKKSACAWEERVLDVDKYAIMHCGVQEILHWMAPGTPQMEGAREDDGNDLLEMQAYDPETYNDKVIGALCVSSSEVVGNWCESRVGSNTTEQQGMLKRALEFNWQMLLEDIGLWIPPTIYHIEHDDKPENEPEGYFVYAAYVASIVDYILWVINEIIPGPPLPPECNTELHTDYGGTAVRWGLTHHKESAADCCQACIDQAKMARPGALKCNIWVYCPSEYGCYSPDKYEHKHQECWLKQFRHILASPSSDPGGHWSRCKSDLGGCSATQIATLQGLRSGMLTSLRQSESKPKAGVFINSCFAHCQSELQDTWFAPNSPSIDNKSCRNLIPIDKADHPRLNFKDRYPELYRDSHPTAPVVVPWMSGVITAM